MAPIKIYEAQAKFTATMVFPIRQQTKLRRRLALKIESLIGINIIPSNL